jgi:transposase-like protein
LTLRWRGGAITTLEIPLPRSHPPALRTDEDTIELVRRLAVHYPDALVAGVLNRQGRRTVRGERFTAGQVGNPRRYWKIPRFQPPATAPAEPAPTIRHAAQILEVAPSTLHRWLNDGFIAGEQDTPGAPWRIRLTEELKARFVADIPPGYLPMMETTKRLGVSRQTVLQRVKRGELHAVHVRCGRRKGLCIKAIDTGPDLFDPAS